MAFFLFQPAQLHFSHLVWINFGAKTPDLRQVLSARSVTASPFSSCILVLRICRNRGWSIDLPTLPEAATPSCYQPVAFFF